VPSRSGGARQADEDQASSERTTARGDCAADSHELMVVGERVFVSVADCQEVETPTTTIRPKFNAPIGYAAHELVRIVLITRRNVLTSPRLPPAPGSHN
jgi:hypothetical protein